MFSLSIFLTLMIASSTDSASTPPSIFRQPVKNMYFRPGELIRMPCEATGEPKPNYYWLKNGRRFNPHENDGRVTQRANSGTLDFYRPEERDVGIYQCFAENTFGTSVSVKCDLGIPFLGEFSSIPPKTHRVRAGSPLTLDCDSPRSIPVGDVFWIILEESGRYEIIVPNSRVTVDKEDHLRFTKVLPEDGNNRQSYVCVVSNPILRRSIQSLPNYIEVVGPEINEPVRILWSDAADLMGLEGDQFTIQCIFSGNPNPEIFWSRTDGQNLTSRHNVERFGQVLSIERLQQEDAGSYECRATSATSTVGISSRFQVRVEARPNFTQKPQNFEANIGGNAEFHCDADGVPSPDIKWRINGLDLTDEKQTKSYTRPSNTVLYFANVSETDHLVVQCNASNRHGYIFENAYLNVLSDPPQFTKLPEVRVKTAVGLNTSLSCNATGEPDPLLEWLKDGEKLPSGGRFRMPTVGTLEIQEIAMTDAGVYQCVASNNFGEVSANGQLIVRRKTSIEHKPSDIVLNAGSQARFTCTATTDPEEIDKLVVYWLKDGNSVSMSDQRKKFDHQDNSLTINETVVYDSGTYTCEATNGIDVARASAILTVKDKPNPPYDLIVMRCRDMRAFIAWTAGLSNNAPLEYYTLQYSTAFNPGQWNFAMDVNGSQSSVTFDLSPWVEYTFRLIAHNEIGPSEPSHSTSDICETRPTVPSYHPRNLRTRGDRKNRLYIEWTPIPQIDQNGPGCQYILAWVPLDSMLSHSQVVTAIPDCKMDHYEINTGDVYAPYRITIRAQNHLGEATQEATPIIGYSFEDTPTIKPTNLTLEEKGETYVIFTWNFPNAEITKLTGSKIRGRFMGFKMQFWQQINNVNKSWSINITRDSVINTTSDVFTYRVDDMTPDTNMQACISVLNSYYIGEPSETVNFKTLKLESKSSSSWPEDNLGLLIGLMAAAVLLISIIAILVFVRQRRSSHDL